jgi:hypothetical protein
MDERRRRELKLGLALQVRFLRMMAPSPRCGVHRAVVPTLLWRHLGGQFHVAAPDCSFPAPDVPARHDTV